MVDVDCEFLEWTHWLECFSNFTATMTASSVSKDVPNQTLIEWAHLFFYRCLALKRMTGANLPRALGSPISIWRLALGALSIHSNRTKGCGASFLQSFNKNWIALAVDWLGYFLRRICASSRYTRRFFRCGGAKGRGTCGISPTLAK